MIALVGRAAVAVVGSPAGSEKEPRCAPDTMLPDYEPFEEIVPGWESQRRLWNTSPGVP